MEAEHGVELVRNWRKRFINFGGELVTYSENDYNFRQTRSEGDSEKILTTLRRTNVIQMLRDRKLGRYNKKSVLRGTIEMRMDLELRGCFGVELRSSCKEDTISLRQGINNLLAFKGRINLSVIMPGLNEVTLPQFQEIIRSTGPILGGIDVNDLDRDYWKIASRGVKDLKLLSIAGEGCGSIELANLLAGSRDYLETLFILGNHGLHVDLLRRAGSVIHLSRLSAMHLSDLQFDVMIEIISFSTPVLKSLGVHRITLNNDSERELCKILSKRNKRILDGALEGDSGGMCSMGVLDLAVSGLGEEVFKLVVDMVSETVAEITIFEQDIDVRIRSLPALRKIRIDGSIYMRTRGLRGGVLGKLLNRRRKVLEDVDKSIDSSLDESMDCWMDSSFEY